ncbi:hypothetical protein IX54_09590 [Paracoccus sanguinis]|nr:hypothetical protein IX54_09590 [Paracoccus sanguinis]
MIPNVGLVEAVPAVGLEPWVRRFTGDHTDGKAHLRVNAHEFFRVVSDGAQCGVQAVQSAPVLCGEIVDIDQHFDRAPVGLQHGLIVAGFCKPLCIVVQLRDDLRLAFRPDAAVVRHFDFPKDQPPQALHYRLQDGQVDTRGKLGDRAVRLVDFEARECHFEVHDQRVFRDEFFDEEFFFALICLGALDQISEPGFGLPMLFVENIIFLIIGRLL